MTEPLYLAFFVWVLVFFAELLRLEPSEPNFTSESRRLLGRCAWCMAGAELTRYDGWFLAAVVAAVVAFLSLRRREDAAFMRAAVLFSLAVAAAPLLWLVYNGAVYGNPLEFANCPYSAKAM